MTFLGRSDESYTQRRSKLNWKKHNMQKLISTSAISSMRFGSIDGEDTSKVKDTSGWYGPAAEQN